MKKAIIYTLIGLTFGASLTSCTKKPMTQEQRKKKLEKKKKRNPDDCPKVDC